MSDVIAGYRCLTPMQTAGSGSARWCMAERGAERFFLKEFLNPVYPVNPDTPLGKRQLERCRRFESRKQCLYAASSCVIGDVLVPVMDFFRFDGHYYAVSEAMNGPTAEKLRMADDEKRKLLYQLALCLQRLHAQGVVHADLKPEHVLLDNGKPKLIDLDSGFLLDDPPVYEREMEGDPAYLAPEMFLRMTGREAALGTGIDVFAFGILIHQIWTGELPGFDHSRYHYLYEAALDNGGIVLGLPKEWQPMIGRMLNASPEKRPEDAEITALFAPEQLSRAERKRPANGLRSLMRA